MTFSANSIRFGTDGWRAVIGDDYTFTNLKRVAQAYADYLNNGCDQNVTDAPADVSLAHKSNERPLIIVGFDGRFLSKEFARLAAQVMIGNDFEVALFDEPIPTPLVSWGVREKKAVGGIVITASHNSAEYNGFKIKIPQGSSAPPAVVSAVESFIKSDSTPRLGNLSETAGAEITESVVAGYRAQISSFFDLEALRSAKTKIVIDSIHGCGARWIESFLRGGEIEVETIRAEYDPLFGGVVPEPTDSNLAALKNRVRETKAILGLATDGDADRLGAVNERGEMMTMSQIVPLLLLHLIRHRGMSGGAAYTFSQSVVTRRIAAAHGLPLFETPIGFSHLADVMHKENVLIGAEESGGIGISNHLPERDGIFNSLLLLEAVAAGGGKTPSEIVRDIHREFGEFYYDRRDLNINLDYGREFVARLAQQTPLKVAEKKVSGVETLDGTKLLFSDESWLLFRQSGTEPLLRVYAEATSTQKVKELLDEAERMLKDNQK